MFQVENHGTIVLIRPLTDEVERWLSENVDSSVMRFGRAFVVEPRYVEPIVTALIEEGYAAQ
jgi:hypothetical protein